MQLTRNSFGTLRIVLSVLLLVSSVYPAFSQSNRKQKLQDQYSSILNDIKKIQSEINQTDNERKAGLKQMALLNSKITTRKKLISNIEAQKSVIDNELHLRLKEVSSLSDEIEVLKQEYVKLIQWLGKNRNNTSKLAFILEADGFKDAFNRIQYIKKYGNFRVKQSAYLQNQLRNIMEKVDALNQTKVEKVNIIKVNKSQELVLKKEKEKRNELVLKMDEELKALKKKISDKNKQAEAINAKIRKIINDEIRKEALRKERERAKERKEGKEEKPEDLSKTPEGMLSSSFQRSKGSLPWPVSSGVVSSKYGRTPHPAAPDLFIDNIGIDIKTSNNAPVKAIYKGTVIRIFQMSSFQNCVMVKHGDYFSVYSYLQSVDVSEGMELSAGHKIGVCAFDESHGYSLVNLQIWHYQNKQNPESWLSGR